MRHEFSKQTKAAAFQRCGGYCEGENCGIKIRPGGFHYDHDNPDYFSGDNALDNCKVLCIRCHKRKTAEEDQPNIAKAKRRWEKDRNITRPKKKMPYRRFNGERVYPK